MNARLLRLAVRHGRRRRWHVFGDGSIHFLPSCDRTMWPGAASISWPSLDGRRSVRLDWHWRIAKAEIHKLVKGRPDES